LQVYLLIHDDWMDGDELRRGGPSVPAMMRARFGSLKLADASAILAGDYAAGLALDALLSVPCSAGRVAKAARELARVEKDVVAGQLLDVHASQDGMSAALPQRGQQKDGTSEVPPRRGQQKDGTSEVPPRRGQQKDDGRSQPPRHADVELMHSLKTASYTVRAPVLIGARLAGASDPACDALESFAEPLGVAFQLRDDVLGTFGDPKATGKPSLSDLRQGKRTALIAEAARDPASRELLRVVGDADASVTDLEALARYLAESGVRARVEARIDTLLAKAHAALETPLVPESARLALQGSILALGRRER
jgi:geranylgeranyl diphosphate synthase type I